MEEKIERQVERFNAKWEKVKGKLQSDYYKQSNILEAEEKTKEAEAQIIQLETLLEQTINVNDAVNWEELKNHRPFNEVSPANYLQTRLEKIIKPIKTENISIPAEPIQTDNHFKPQFNFLEKYIFKSWQQKKIDQSIQDFKNAHSNWLAEKTRIEKQNKENIATYEQNLIIYNQEIEKTKKQNQDEVIDWEKRKEQYYKDQSDYNNKIDLMKAEYLEKRPHSIIENCDLVLNNSKYPDYFPKTYELDYNPERQLIIVDFCLPQIESLPRTKSVKYVKTEDNFKETSISNTALNQLYSNVIFQVAIRTVHEIFEADIVNAISTVCFNGYIENNGIEYIISYQADKETFNKLNLKGLDCKETIKNYKGKFSTKLTKVEPLMKIHHIIKQQK